MYAYDRFLILELPLGHGEEVFDRAVKWRIGVKSQLERGASLFESRRRKKERM
jgi:hypothetical protein